MLDHILLAIITLFCAYDCYKTFRDEKQQKEQIDILNGILTELVIRNSEGDGSNN